MASTAYYQGRQATPSQKAEENEFVIDATSHNTIILNSYDRNPITDPNNFIVNKAAIFNGIYRLSPAYLNINYSVPNCNPRNNSFILEDPSGVNPSVTVTLPTQVILSNTDLVTALNTQLSTLVGYFAGIVASIDPLLKRIRLTGAANQFRVNAGFRNENLTGFFDNVAYTPAQRTSALSGGVQVYNGLPPPLLYTNVLIFASQAVTRFSKSDKSTGIDIGGEFLRFYIDEFFFNTNYGNFISVSIGLGSGSKQLKFAPSADLSNPDIKVYDQYGDLVYYDRLTSIFEYSILFNVINMPDQ